MNKKAKRSILTAVDDLAATGFNNDFPHIVVPRVLVLDDDLVFARLDEPGEHEDVICTLVLPLLDLFGVEGLSARNLARDRRLRHVADEDVLLRIRQVLFHPLHPVLVVDHFELVAKGVLHALTDR